MAEAQNELTRKDDTRMNVFKDILQTSPQKLSDMFRKREFEDLEALLNRLPNPGRDRDSAFDVIKKAFALVKYPLYEQSQTYADLTANNFHTALVFVYGYITSSRATERAQGALVKTAADATKLAQEKEAQRAELERLTLELQTANEKLTDLAYKDQLTKCYNRMFFDTQLKAEIEESQRHKNRPLSLIYLDLDGYKQVNDTFGHEAGDHILRDVAKTISGVVQDRRTSTDMFCRLGGDEFTLLLPITDEAGAAKLAERVLAVVKNTQFKYVGNSVPIGVTLGVAQHIPGEDSGLLYLRADKALYVGKAWGKGRVVTDTLLTRRLRESKEFPEKLMADYRIIHPALKDHYFGISQKDTDLKIPTT